MPDKQTLIFNPITEFVPCRGGSAYPPETCLLLGQIRRSAPTASNRSSFFKRSVGVQEFRSVDVCLTCNLSSLNVNRSSFNRALFPILYISIVLNLISQIFGQVREEGHASDSLNLLYAVYIQVFFAVAVGISADETNAFRMFLV